MKLYGSDIGAIELSDRLDILDPRILDATCISHPARISFRLKEGGCENSHQSEVELALANEFLIGCVWGYVINTNATNSVHGANSAIAIASSMNKPSVCNRLPAF